MTRARRQNSPHPAKDFRKKSAAARPVCPCCGRRAPAFRTEDYCGSAWGGDWGHRCPHGEPCPAWSDKELTCAVCAEREKDECRTTTTTE